MEGRHVTALTGSPPPLTAWLGEADEELLLDLLGEVVDPELGVNIVDLGLVYSVRVVTGVAQVTMTLTAPGCPLAGYLEDAVRRALVGAPGIREVAVRIVFDPPWSPEAMMSETAKAALGWRR